MGDWVLWSFDYFRSSIPCVEVQPLGRNQSQCQVRRGIQFRMPPRRGPCERHGSNLLTHRRIR